MCATLYEGPYKEVAHASIPSSVKVLVAALGGPEVFHGWTTLPDRIGFNRHGDSTGQSPEPAARPGPRTGVDGRGPPCDHSGCGPRSRCLLLCSVEGGTRRVR